MEYPSFYNTKKEITRKVNELNDLCASCLKFKPFQIRGSHHKYYAFLEANTKRDAISVFNMLMANLVQFNTLNIGYCHNMNVLFTFKWGDNIYHTLGPTIDKFFVIGKLDRI